MRVEPARRYLPLDSDPQRTITRDHEMSPIVVREDVAEHLECSFWPLLFDQMTDEPDQRDVFADTDLTAQARGCLGPIDPDEALG